MTKNAEMVRKRVDIRTPSSAAKSPRADGAYSFAAPQMGWPFSLGLSETSCRDTKNVRPNRLRVKRKSYIVKGLLLSGFCSESNLSCGGRRAERAKTGRSAGILARGRDNRPGVAQQPSQDRSMTRKFRSRNATRRTTNGSEPQSFVGKTRRAEPNDPH